MRPPPHVLAPGLLRALMIGVRCKIGGADYEMGYGEIAGEVCPDICVVGTRETLGSGEPPQPCLLRSGMQICDLIWLAERMTDDEWVVIAASATIVAAKRRSDA